MKAYDKIFEIGKTKYPNEACGLIVEPFEIIECANIAVDPKQYFLLDPQDYIKTARESKIVGVWHTHCEQPGVPSMADKAGCEASDMPWVIVGMRKNESGEIEKFEQSTIVPTGYRADYVGRPYVFGIFDCYTLVADYYEKELGIKLERRPSWFKPLWWENGEDFFVQEFKQQGFKRLIDQEIQQHDIFLMQIRSPVANHIGVYVGEDKILHHTQERLSKEDVYGGSYWMKHTVHHLRHESKC